MTGTLGFIMSFSLLLYILIIFHNKQDKNNMYLDELGYKLVINVKSPIHCRPKIQEVVFFS